MSDDMLTKFSRNLGVEDVNTIKKANELLRLIQLKNFKDANESAKIIFCIESASMLCGTEFDHLDVATKLSGLKPKEYTRKKQLFEKLLGLTKQLKISDICCQLNLPESIQNDATNLIYLYKFATSYNDEMQSSHNMAMAIYQCCKYRKLKIKIKSKLITIGNLDGSKWKRLEEQWDKWIETNEPFKNKQFTAALQQLHKIDTMIDENSLLRHQKEAIVEEIPYEEWKKTMLDKAMRYLQKPRNS